ncbi:hypothetical protein ACJJTC_017293 [Scirpophaga incertulas]
MVRLKIQENKVNKERKYLIKIFKPILIVMIIFGFNYMSCNRIATRILFSFYSLTLMAVFIYSTVRCCNIRWSMIWYTLEYTGVVVTLLIYRSKILVYLQKLIHLDTYLRISFHHYYRTRRKQMMIMLIVLMVRLCHTHTYCSYYNCYNHIVLYLIYELSLFGMDFHQVWRFCMFEEIWRRLNLLRRRLEEFPESDIYLYVKNQKTMKENKIKFCFFLYRYIAELLDLISPELDISFLISIVCSLPKLILNVYYILLVIDRHWRYETLGFMLIHLTLIAFFIFTPCAIVSYYGAEVQKIRLVLFHQLIYENDHHTIEDIRFFLQYTYLKPFKHKIWRMVQVDLSLPLALLNLCTTYVIVVVNFTQVFNRAD